MIPFAEAERYNLPNLTPDSVVLDIGAYEGRWGRLIAEKYSCEVHFFEPLATFFIPMCGRLLTHPHRNNMQMRMVGIGAETGYAQMGVKGDMSGSYADGPKHSVQIVGVKDLLCTPPLYGRQIGAMKVNAEGSEFPILEALLKHDLMHRIDVLHVQPHTVVPDYQARWDAIMAGVAKTHDLVFNAPWIWCGWERRK